jgi:hypothetical protein
LIQILLGRIALPLDFLGTLLFKMVFFLFSFLNDVFLSDLVIHGCLDLYCWEFLLLLRLIS